MVNVNRVGSSAEIARQAKIYHPKSINVEVAGQQWTFYNETAAALKSIGWHGVLRPEPAPAEGKVEKLKQVPLVYFEAGLYHLGGVVEEDGQLGVNDECRDLKNDIVAFPDCHKDRLDMLYLAEQVVEFPDKIEYDPLGTTILINQREKNDDGGYEPPRDVEGWMIV
jgi:hypothetical protein